MNAPSPCPAGQWPESMERGRLADAAFAAAYGRTSDRERAWIKTGLAAAYAALGGPLPARRQFHQSLGHDLLYTVADAPLDYVVVVCGREFLSPARLAAAVAAPLCARVADVAAVRLGGAWPKPLLTTLELCGVETACTLKAGDLAGLVEALPAKGRGAVIALGEIVLPRSLPAGLDVHRARIAGRAGLYGPDDAGFDPAALAFAHPDMAFYRHGAPCPELPGWTVGQGGLAEAGGCGYDVVYAAPEGFAQAVDAAPLLLGPGRETFWLWPHLVPDVFRVRRLGAAVATPDLR